MIGGTPATPPGVRVRTGRFESLRSGEPGYTQSVEVANSQHGLEQAVTVAPTP